MSQIKVTVTEKERDALLKEATGKSTTISKLVHRKLFHPNNISEPALPSEIHRTERADLWASVPKTLLTAVNDEAKNEHLSRSEYITRLLLQKGTPVNIIVSNDPSIYFSASFSQALQNIKALKRMADKSGTIYSSELNAAIRDLDTAYQETLVAINKMNKSQRHAVDEINASLFRAQKAR